LPPINQVDSMEVKDRILQKANDLFMRYGIRSVTMDEIAGQLGISKKTIYQFYSDKDELVHAVFHEIMQKNHDNCIKYREDSDNAIHEQFLASDMVQEMFANMNPSILFDMQRFHPKVFAEFEKYKKEFIYSILKDNIKRGIAEGLFREDIDVDIIARLQLLTVSLLHDDEFVQYKNGLAAIERQTKEFFLYGLATAKGQKLIQKYKQQRQKQ